ncbi:NACHT and WD repeat domain-containing protein [Granulicoccus phenolivorans]|uniref:NACHT and WD repeat domain-containing protein n=3 Tax=Granulicoccus phenolivorans TaxID=266854 RepID=UPI00146FD152|nr:AAA family ATPase [Granulicoccus phenolivorans]
MELFAFDFGEFDHFGKLDATAEVTEVARLLADFGVEQLRPWEGPMTDRGADAVEARFHQWSGAEASSGPTVLYWVGHGWATSRKAALAHARSPEVVGESGISPAKMAAAITDWEARTPETTWLWVIIDACKSARFVELLSSALDDRAGPRRIAILGTSAASSTNLGEFTRHLAVTLQHNFAGNAAIPLTQLVDELWSATGGARRVLELKPETVLRRAVPLAEGFTGPLDARNELALVLADLPEDERRHFVTKAQGGELGADTLGEITWHFTGRDAERRDLLTRMSAGGLVVVTGRAGSGKSALLGDLVVRSRPAVAAVLRRHRLLDDIVGEVPHVDAALQLTGLGLGEVLVRLCGALGFMAPSPTLPLTMQLDEFLKALSTLPQNVRIVVDALDEAVAPLDVGAALRRIGASPRVTLVVGTRRSTREGPDQPDPMDRNLLNTLGVTDEHTIRVERDPDLIVKYVKRRLNSLVAEQTVTDEQVTSAAQAIAGVDQEVLYARLATYELLQRPELVVAPDLVSRLGLDHRSVFAGAVARFANQDPQFRSLLLALALAQGRGLPIREGVWAAVASSVGESSAITDESVHRLIDVAAPYLALDVEHEQTVYRLAHRTFAEHLTANPDETAVRHAQIVGRAIIEVDPATPTNPYWQHYTSAHCVAAGRSAWEQLDRAPALDALAPRAVAQDAMRSLFGWGPLPSRIAASIYAAEQLQATPPSQRAAVRRLAMFRVAANPTDTEAPLDQPWWPVWAATRRYPVQAILPGHSDRVKALAVLPLPNGQTLLASGSDDHTVRLWDPATGKPVGDPLTGHTREVRALAVLPLPDGRTLLASGSGDHTVRLWDPVTGKPVGDPLTGHTRGVETLAVLPLPDGRTLLASGSGDHTVRLWDPVAKVCWLEVHTLGYVQSLVPAGPAQLGVGMSDGLVMISVVGSLPSQPMQDRHVPE